MPRWLTKARRVVRRGRSRLPEPFEVVSSAGETVTGVRQREHQVVECPVTGERLFVLPRDVYPPVSTAAPGSKRPGRPGRRSPAQHESRGRRADTSEDSGRSTRRAFASSTWRRRVTPLRLAGLVMILLIAGTAYWIARVRSVEWATRTLQTATERGDAALAAGDVETAADEYADVVRALDVLGRDDPYLRQRGRELDVLTHLGPRTLRELVEEAHGFAETGDLDDWQSRFDRRFADGWLVFDATVHETVNVDGERVTRVDFPLDVEGQPVDVVLGAGDHGLLEGGSESRVVFASRIDRVERTADEFPRWRVVLDADRAFPWCAWATYEAVGLASGIPEVDETTQALLKRQAKRAGVEP